MSEPDAVIIIAPVDDLHARTVAWEIEKLGGAATILDLHDFPARWRLTFRASATLPFDFEVETEDGAVIGNDNLRGLWWRRTRPFDIPAAVANKAHRRFCRNECSALFEGWIHALGSRVINPLEAEAAAQRKPYQLAVAAHCGFPIPETMITNAPTSVRSLVGERPSTFIYKGLTTLHDAPAVFTRKLDQETLADLDLLETAPAIFQQAISGVDLRVTIVGDAIFPARLRPSHPEAAFDWRKDPAVATEPCALPDKVATGLLLLHRRLGLHYGAYDLRVDGAGKHVFLEVNCGGQYLWVETDVGLPISAAIARLLLTQDKP